jgi:hypothetical protein
MQIVLNFREMEMPDKILGKIVDATTCRSRINSIPWNGCGVYVLWDRLSSIPVYCGTSKTRGRLLSHLKKNDPKSIPTSHNLANAEFTKFWQGKSYDWLGVSFEAKIVERGIIAHYGIRRLGGLLYNQRMSG